MVTRHRNLAPAKTRYRRRVWTLEDHALAQDVVRCHGLATHFLVWAVAKLCLQCSLLKVDGAVVADLRNGLDAMQV